MYKLEIWNTTGYRIKTLIFSYYEMNEMLDCKKSYIDKGYTTRIYKACK